MRFTRAAKVAAFPLTALILVALVACQGPAGLDGAAGAKGDAGTPGSMGTPGTSGTPGVDAFQAATDVDATLLNPKDIVDEDGVALESGTTKEYELYLAPLFVGGLSGRSYTPGTFALLNDMGTVVTGKGSLTAKLDETKTKLLYSLTAPTSNEALEEGVLVFSEEAYKNGFVGTVSARAPATDGRMVNATATVTIKLNRPPQLKGGNTARDNAILLGTQDKDRGTELGAVAGLNKVCEKINACELDVFEDDEDALTVSVTKMTVNDIPNSTKVASTPTMGSVMLTGMASTWVIDPDAGNAHSSVAVELTAVDSKLLETKAIVMIQVDAAPTISAIGMRFEGSSHDITESLVLAAGDGTSLFKDDYADGRTLGVDGKSDPEGAVEVEANTSDGVKLTGRVLGRATVTVVATEGGGTDNLGQTAEITLSVDVKKVDPAP